MNTNLSLDLADINTTFEVHTGSSVALAFLKLANAPATAENYKEALRILNSELEQISSPAGRCELLALHATLSNRMASWAMDKITKAKSPKEMETYAKVAALLQGSCARLLALVSAFEAHEARFSRSVRLGPNDHRQSHQMTSDPAHANTTGTESSPVPATAI
jgi:hypothetical protein